MYRRKRDLYCEYLPGPCENHDLSRLDNQPFKRDRLIGIGFVLNFVKFILFTFGDKEMISVIEAIIREVFVKLLLDSFWKLSVRVDVRTYLLGGAIDSSEAIGIIRDPKLELDNSRFTFDLVPLSYESVDVVVGENWLLRHKVEMVCHEKVVKMPWSCKVRVGSNGNLLWEACVLLGRKKGGVQVAREDDRGVTEGREDVREVFQQRVSRAKRKLSRCGRNQMGYELILALSEGADDFVVYYDARSKDLEACLEKGRRLTNRWLSMKKDIASCGSKYLAYLEVEVEYQGSSGLLLQPETSMVDFRGNWNTHFREMSFSLRWGLSFEYGCASFEAWYGKEYVRLDNQFIERDRLIGIGFVLDFAEFISFTFGDKEMISVIEAVSL
ncbi:putative reverse transcriptase domain-containing protein [Tanacetum coccineum]